MLIGTAARVRHNPFGIVEASKTLGASAAQSTGTGGKD